MISKNIIYLFFILPLFLSKLGTSQCNVSAGTDISLDCNTTSGALNGSGGATYSWFPTTDLNDPTLPNPIANPTITTIYTLTITGTDGCTETDVVTVNVDISPPTINAGLDVTNNCFTPTTNLNATGGDSYSWSPSAGLNLDNIGNPIANPTATTTYTVTGTGTNGCTATDDVEVTIDSSPIS